MYQHGTRALMFPEWMRLVDSRIGTLTLGMRSMDMPDCDYRGWYDGGLNPTEAADAALEEAGYPSPEHDY